MSHELRSDCCTAKLLHAYADDFRWFECSKCGRSCYILGDEVHEISPRSSDIVSLKYIHNPNFMSDDEQSREMTCVEWCERLRKNIKLDAEEVKSFSDKAKASPAWTTQGEPSLAGEVIANAILAYRHLEDAAMRLGKAIQASDGGKSVYDK